MHRNSPMGNLVILGLLCLLQQRAQGYQHTLQQPPRITEHPIDVTVAKNEPATLNCHATGEPEPTITWYRDGVPVRTATQDQRSHRVLLPAGSLFFLRVAHGRKESDSGVYFCEATNALGKARSRNATLTVAVLKDDFRLEPQNARIAAGEDVVLECGPPKGTPEPTVTWRKDGHTLEIEGRLKLVDGASLAITDARSSDDGRYQCIAKNTAGVRESASAFIKVHVKPFLIKPPEDLTTLVGSSVEFTCEVGGDPLPDVLWRRQAPGGAMPLGRVRVLEDRSLRLERVTLSDQGKYICEADNAAGDLSASATLTVHASPSFSTRPLAQTVEVGHEVSFHCNAHGSPKPFIFWSFEGDRTLIFPGTNSGSYEAFITSEGHSTLLLKNAQVVHSGTVIVCSAVNAAGSVSTRTRLTVSSKESFPPPVIIRGPVNQTLPINSVAVLTCEVIGNPEPVISWYKEGIPVQSSMRINFTKSGNLEISHLNPNEDSGVYTCVASSKSGKATWTGYLKVENPKNPNINFFKAPEAVMLPGPPSRPHALNQSETSVTITWGQSNRIGSSSLLGYQIELFGREEGVIPTWTIVARRVLGPTFTQHLLTPGIPYTFLVRAENAHGLGAASDLSEQIFVGNDAAAQNWGNPEVTELSEARANLISGSIIRLVEVIPVLSTAVKLNWDILDPLYVEGLYIYYISLDSAPDLPKSYSMLTVLHTGTSSGFTVNNLNKWSRYEFFIVPFYKTIEGQPSNSRTVRTLEDVPSKPPINMEAILLNASAVNLRWKSPPMATLNGELQGYKVEVHSNGTETSSIATVGTAPTLLLGNLTSGVSYNIRVAALTRAGLGPYSLPATLRLDPANALDHHQRPINSNLEPVDFITETWFMALLISMVTVMVLLFAAMLLVRRRQLLSKKALPQSRSNGGVLTTPINGKLDPPLWMDKDNLPDYTSTLPGYAKLSQQPDYYNNSLNGVGPKGKGKNGLSINLHTNPLHQEKYSRPNQLDYDCGKDYGNMQIVQEYASPNVENRNGAIADYAEVDTNLSGINGGAVSPAPYATTTLVTGNRRIGNSMIWNPNNNHGISTTASALDEDVYPASNGGYYNRKVYSDSYFAPNNSNQQTLKRHSKKERKNANQPDLVSPNNQPVYARVGPPGMSWRGPSPQLSSFTPSPHHKQLYHPSTRSEPGNML
ncbi:roundabout homolog 1-like isoform X1 [Atheta coriaria]|uniref:roundabout homolog 1-like isoform X1 n=1 Tax=Dalotia coriaria TaxID=877792 RepID=UPI0031F44AA5